MWIDHRNGYRTLYLHLFRTDAVVGTKVTTEDLIGLSGNTGLTTGPHLHFGLEDEDQLDGPMRGFIDPWPFIAA